jgi:diguanylate cyclase (GGDEF)-like protein
LPGNFPIRHNSHFVTGVILAPEVTRCEAQNDRNQDISSRLAEKLKEKDMMVRHDMGIEDVQVKRTHITTAPLFHHWRMLVVAAVMAAGIAATWLAVRLEDPSRASKPFRIGFQQSPPYQYVTNGQRSGPAIEIVAEAARRRHIPVEWVLAPDGPESNLRNGNVDLWPLLGDLPERRKFLYISDPWVSISFSLVALESSGISSPRDTVGRSLWFTGVNVAMRVAQTNFPGARLEPQPTNVIALEGVCSGKADAGMIAGSKADAPALQNLPACRNARLKYYPLSDGNMNYGIGASFHRPDASSAADAIRDEIGTMSRDGTVSAVYFSWFRDPTNDTSVIYYLTELQRRNLYLWAGLGALTLLLGLFVWQTVRLRSAQQAADRLNTELQAASAELAAANMELKEASLTDPLTHLHNRRFFDVIIGNEVNKSLRQYADQPARGESKAFLNRDIVFYLVDIDHFKSVNDLYGHPVGDTMLVEAARRIGSAMRRSDTLIRWGGEEFLVVSFPTDRREAETLARRIMSEFSERPFELGNAISVRKTCSVGWAPFPWFVADPGALGYEEVLKLADRALYAAKEAGRNCSVGLIPTGADPTYRTAGAEDASTQTPKSERVPVRTLRTAGPAVHNRPTASANTEPPLRAGERNSNPEDDGNHGPHNRKANQSFAEMASSAGALKK